MARLFGCNLDKKKHLDKTVLQWLQGLTNDFCVFVEVEGGDFSVDFLVLKSCGIFNIEAKQWNVLDARADADWVLRDGERRPNPFHEQVLDQCEKFKGYLRVQRHEVFGVDRADLFETYQSGIRIFPVVALSFPGVEPTIEHHVWRRIFAKELGLRQHVNRFSWFPNDAAKPFSLIESDIKNLARLFHIEEVDPQTLLPCTPPYAATVAVGQAAAKQAPVAVDSNPYQITYAVTGAHFYGRTNELKRVKRNLEQGLPVAIVGQQRTGKSSLADESIVRMFGGNPSYTVIKFDLRRLKSEEFTPDADLALEFLRGMAKDISDSTLNKILDDHRERAVKSSLAEQRRLFRSALLKNREYGRRTVLFLDECDEIVLGLGEHRSQSFIAYLDSLCRERELGLNLIIAGRPAFFDLGPVKEINFGRLFQTILRLGPLEHQPARELIERGAPTLQFDDSGRERLQFITGNHPFWLQLLCHKLFEEAVNESFSVCDAERVNKIFTMLMKDPAYKPQFLLLYQDVIPADSSFELLKTIAEAATEEGQSVPLSQVAPDWRTNKEVNGRLNVLIDNQIIAHGDDPNQPSCRFEVEGLRQWMRWHLMTL
jgi:hypothetical protein